MFENLASPRVPAQSGFDRHLWVGGHFPLVTYFLHASLKVLEIRSYMVQAILLLQLPECAGIMAADTASF